jgi:HSP20 family molecular chaperone IbpA
MTGRMSLFDHPFFLGFDRFERELERAKKSAAGYPPYNVEQVEDNTLRITLAVAGFSQADLEITVENNQLIVRGQQAEDAHDRNYLYRGIAARQFQRSFVLADGIEVGGAWLDNGLLHIEMERIVPETRTRRIEIAHTGENGKQAVEVTGRAGA